MGQYQALGYSSACNKLLQGVGLPKTQLAPALMHASFAADFFRKDPVPHGELKAGNVPAFLEWKDRNGPDTVLPVIDKVHLFSVLIFALAKTDLAHRSPLIRQLSGSLGVAQSITYR